MAVGAPGKNLVYIVYLKRDGGVGVLSFQTIAPPTLTADTMMFGGSLAVMGDIDTNDVGEEREDETERGRERERDCVVWVGVCVCVCVCV